jgi:riboflavin kinase/FMN adenylyltransferase
MATHTLDWQETVPETCRRGAVTVGNFDGVHRGHAALVAELTRLARVVAGPAVAVIFDPHPLEILRPQQMLPVLTTIPDRVQLLHELGAEQVVVLHTTRELLSLTAADFFAHVLQERLAVRALVEGVNFGFGRGREGNAETLAKLCQHAEVRLTLVPPVRLGDAEVSSSRVRAALLTGDVSDAATLLGRPYRLRGIVGTGQRRGRTIGFPTANLDRPETLAPGDGVYAVRAFIGAAQYPAAANVGPNPTFGESARKIEVHVVGFDGDLYGQPLTVEFVRRLRDTRPFASVTELVEQLERDVAEARGAIAL